MIPKADLPATQKNKPIVLLDSDLGTRHMHVSSFPVEKRVMLGRAF